MFCLHVILLYYPIVRQVLALCAILAAAIPVHGALQMYGICNYRIFNFQTRPYYTLRCALVSFQVSFPIAQKFFRYYSLVAF